MQVGNFIDVFLARHVFGWVVVLRPPPIQKLGAENRMLQLNI